MDILHNGLILPDATPTGGPSTTVLNLQDGTGISWVTTRKAGVVVATPSVVSAALPGSEIGYDPITSGVSVVSTNESAGTTIITCSPHTFDGSPTLCHFFSVFALSGTTAGSDVIVSLFEGSTQIARVASLQTSGVSQAGVPMNGFIRFTPTSGSHTYTITAFTTNTTGGVSISAGTNGTGNNPPAFVRFTKV